MSTSSPAPRRPSRVWAGIKAIGAWLAGVFSREYRSPYGGYTSAFLALASWFAVCGLAAVGAFLAYRFFDFADVSQNQGTLIVLGVIVALSLYAGRYVVYRRERFSAVTIAVSLGVAILLGSLDYVGYFGHNGYVSYLENKRNETIGKIETFAITATAEISKELGRLDKMETDLADLDKEKAERIKKVQDSKAASINAQKQIVGSATLATELESQGLKSTKLGTSGLQGEAFRFDAKRAAQMEAEKDLALMIERLDGQEKIDIAAIESEITARKAKIAEEVRKGREAMKGNSEMLNGLAIESVASAAPTSGSKVAYKAASTPMGEIFAAKDLLALSKASRRANLDIAKVAGSLAIAAVPIVVESHNVLEMAVIQLLEINYGAWFTLFLAIGIQAADIMFAYVCHQNEVPASGPRSTTPGSGRPAAKRREDQVAGSDNGEGEDDEAESALTGDMPVRQQTGPGEPADA